MARCDIWVSSSKLRLRYVAVSCSSTNIHFYFMFLAQKTPLGKEVRQLVFIFNILSQLMLIFQEHSSYCSHSQKITQTKHLLLNFFQRCFTLMVCVIIIIFVIDHNANFG